MINSSALSSPSATLSAAARWRLVIIAFITIVLDGFDTTSISFVVPTLAVEWGLSPAAFTSAFVTTSVGAVVGYLASGSLTNRLGARKAILCSVLVFALGSFLTVLAQSVFVLATLRLITGIGLGMVLAPTVAMATENFPAHRRELITILVVSGVGFGSVLGGVFGGRLIAAHGWASIYWVGGFLPLVLLPFLWFGLPRDRMDGNKHPNPAEKGTVRSLFAGPLAGSTALLWIFSFSIFTALYALVLWMPTLLLGFGFAPRETALGAASMGAGGLLGVMLLIPLFSKFGTARVLVFASFLSMAAIVAVSYGHWDRAGLLLWIALVGMGLQAGTMGQSALAVGIYSGASRATGVGCAAAAGRIGSIVGPAIGGLLLSLKVSTQDAILTACIPILIGAIAAMAIYYRRGRTASPVVSAVS